MIQHIRTLSKLTAVFAGTLMVASLACAQGFTAKVFDQESNKQKQLFTYKQESVDKAEGRTATNTYTDMEGKTVAIETTEFKKTPEGERAVSYRMQQMQLGTDGKVDVDGGKAKFSFTKEGKTKTAEEAADQTFIAGPAITAYLQSKWADIAKGERVKGRMAVLDRLETVGFEFFKDHEEEINGQKALVVKMKPSSFLIAALVKPLFFAYTTDGKQLLEVRGRTQMKQNVSGSWKDLDAVTTFDYASAGNAK